eukprot:TRINITY_DN7_c0_g1_i3.p1 TRINITY_DN7_c0_g1~~TRINITY_DN7_c0_g1_i3.p1  ORF type:complete len:270 (-),score=86.09 TRINITY_DN7_c0_g1_i3:1064-1873(-)
MSAEPTLLLDGSHGSRGAAVVAKFCSNFGITRIPIKENAEACELVTASGRLSGLTTIAQYLASQDTALATQLIGDGPETCAQVSQWLSLCRTKSPPELAAMNAILQTRSVLVGGGTSLSLADLLVFSQVHDDVAKLSTQEKGALPNLLRWVDYVQNKGDVERVFARIAVDKPKFSPPGPSAPPAPKRPAAAATSSSSAQPSSQVTAEAASSSQSATEDAGDKKEKKDKKDKKEKKEKKDKDKKEKGEGSEGEGKEKKDKKEKEKEKAAH